MFGNIDPLSNTRYTDNAHFECLENLDESSMEISLVHCGIEHCNPLHICQIPRDEYILHFVLDGEGSYSCDGNAWTLKKGQVFLICPGSKYTYVSSASIPWTYAWVGFQGMLCKNILYHCGFSKEHLIGECKDLDRVLSYVNSLIEYRQLTFSNQLRRNGILMELLATLIDSRKADMEGTDSSLSDYGSNVYVSHAVEYIRSFYNQPISVQTISEYVGISRTHLNNCFQKELGLSVQKFLSDYRMHKAANLLITSTDTIQTISASVGYPDSLAFSKSFKKKFGLSPKNYRNQKKTLDVYDMKQ